MEQAISVTKFNTYIKQIFDSEELLHNISIVGEVFGVSFSRNVIYFSLKDETSSLSCVCFYPNFITQIVEGNKVIVTGSPNYYTKAGKFNFNVVRVEKLGQGKLFEEFLRLKQKLEEEGLFDISGKQPMPKKIARIGVITSSEGAVLQDIKNIVWRRNPAVDLVLFNTKVQGNFAEKEIAHAIEVMGSYDKIDAIIVARGGGSLEDLSAYNTEIVARAAYNCPKFLVSAVGHETDYTIIDFVSDLRAPTPSAAAELLTVDIESKKSQFISTANNLLRTFDTFITNSKNELDVNRIRFINTSEKKLNTTQNIVNNLNRSLIVCYENYINSKYYELGLSEVTLNKNNPTEILNKGFAKIEQNGFSVTSINNIDLNRDLSIILKDGKLTATPKEKELKK